MDHGLDDLGNIGSVGNTAGVTSDQSGAPRGNLFNDSSTVANRENHIQRFIYRTSR